MESKTPPQRKLPKANPHDQIEDALIRYQGLALWQKEMEPRAYNELQRVKFINKYILIMKVTHITYILISSN